MDEKEKQEHGWENRGRKEEEEKASTVKEEMCCFTVKIILMQKWEEEGCSEQRPLSKHREVVQQQLEREREGWKGKKEQH